MKFDLIAELFKKYKFAGSIIVRISNENITYLSFAFIYFPLKRPENFVKVESNWFSSPKRNQLQISKTQTKSKVETQLMHQRNLFHTKNFLQIKEP